MLDKQSFTRLKAWLRSVGSAPTPNVTTSTPTIDESAYLTANPDVADAVARGEFRSAQHHFDLFGRAEGRLPGTPAPGLVAANPESFAGSKAEKLKRISSLLRTDMPHVVTGQYYDFLTDELRAQFNIIDTNAVSSNDYDGHVLELIARHGDGWVLDCGAGKRSTYYENVVNFEIAPYDTTDVRGVGEVLPFVDGAFDAVVSIAVLEHVKDPFRCAAEIARVLKPGGDLICCVPFLQPYHGYPHHYYNMTHQGLRNLFSGTINVDRIDVYQSVLPIWSLTWIVHSWAAGLSGKTREDFLAMPLGDLLAPATDFLRSPFVTDLSADKNLELASANVLFGRKISPT